MVEVPYSIFSQAASSVFFGHMGERGEEGLWGITLTLGRRKEHVFST